MARVDVGIDSLKSGAPQVVSLAVARTNGNAVAAHGGPSLASAIAELPTQSVSKDAVADGRCTAKDGQCVVGKDEDCKPLEDCKKYGRCTAKDGKCVATSDADCAQSEKCKDFGHCTAKDGRCVE